MVRHVAQQDDTYGFRSTADNHRWESSRDAVYGTEGYVIYAAGPADGSSPYIMSYADPLTYDNGTIATLVDLPSYLELENNGQDTSLAYSERPEIDDPRITPASSVADIASGMALNNYANDIIYNSVVDIVFTASPPDVVRVGVIARGEGEDGMEAVELAQTGGGTVGARAVRTGDPDIYIQFFDIEGAQSGDRFTISLAKGDHGYNPNVAYFGIVFD